MKKSILTGALLFIGVASTHAQTLYTSNGVLNSARTVSMAGRNLTFQSSTFGEYLFVNGTNGNIGINTNAPSEALDVNGILQANMGFFTNSLANGQVFSSSVDRNTKSTVFTAGTLLDPVQKTRTLTYFDFPQSNYNSVATVWLGINDRSYKTRFRYFAGEGADSHFILYDKNQTEHFKVSEDGGGNVNVTLPKANSRMGIGTTSFTDGTDTYALSVKGNVRADRVKVYTTWADYVFEEDYKLPTLEEVEQHIKEKGHLQDIPSAAEVEANGIELGEMNKLLLQKIEELTLYTIELNKQVQELKSQIKHQ